MALTVVKRRILLISGILLVGIILLIQFYDFQDGRKPVARIRLTGTQALRDICWVSEFRVVFASEDQNKLEIRSVDLQSRQSQVQPVSVQLTKMRNTNDGLSVRCSPDGSKIAVLCQIEKTSKLFQLDMLGNSIAEPAVIPGISGLGMFWSPDSHTLLGTWHTNASTFGVLLTDGTPAKTIQICTNDAAPLGFLSATQFASLRDHSLEATNKVELIETVILSDELLTREHSINLPFVCEILAVKPSPGGSCLAWELLKMRKLPKPVFVNHPPYLRLARRHDTVALWTSTSAGAEFKCSGVAPWAAAGLTWLPSEKAIGFVVDGELFMISLE